MVRGVALLLLQIPPFLANQVAGGCVEYALNQCIVHTQVELPTVMCFLWLRLTAKGHTLQDAHNGQTA